MTFVRPDRRDAEGGVAVSIVIPAYQAEAFVADAIRSALAQTLRDIEVIVVDDGSDDATWEIILACAQEDCRVVPLRNPRRSGPSVARNTAIGEARGRWIALLDADDLFHPTRLERMVVAAEAAQADLLADNMLMVEFGTGARLGPRFSAEVMAMPCPVPVIEAIRRDMPGRSATGEMFGFLQPIMRRDFLRAHGIRYAEDIQIGEDFLLYVECIARGARFHLMPEAYYVQRMRTGSHSAGREAMLHLSQANRRMQQLVEGAADGDLLALLQRRQRQIDIDCFSLLLERGQVREALRYAHAGTPARMLRHARAVLGAVRFGLGLGPGLRRGGRPGAIAVQGAQGQPAAGQDSPRGLAGTKPVRDVGPRGAGMPGRQGLPRTAPNPQGRPPG